MITDKLSNASLYYSCHPAFQKAFEFLNGKLDELSGGRHEIDGQNIFAMVNDMTLCPEGAGAYEAHRKYIDIQYILKASETIAYSNLDQLTPTTEYDDNGDAQLYAGKGSLINLEEGCFAVFFPQDGHMPGILPKGGSVNSRKIIIKVLV